ncbi:MAG: NYN domain-containing protein, partial [Eubacteriales bacterium]|nr:NYN domain-containing protein [Eubacteriales bacterium]
MDNNKEQTSDIRLAVLIDADNISHHNIQGMMEELARYGNATIKRIYGDWTRPNLGGWKNLLLDYAITPVQQFGYTTGKNATDSAMIIDAMDILYSERADAFCLVSSDSDFTRLATRLREAGMTVYGIGEQKTPNSFIAACDRFIYLEILEEPAHEDDLSTPQEQK